MPKLIISIDGVVIKETQLTKDRTTIGRRPYNDVVIDNLAVSGEHAVIKIANGKAVLEDLGSTNGSFVNGRPVRTHDLANDDLIEMGKYKIKYLQTNGVSIQSGLAETHADSQPPTVRGVDSDYLTVPDSPELHGPRVRVLSGPSAGRELLLNKPVNTIGKRGLSVAAISRKAHGFELSHIEGGQVPAVNGISVDAGPIVLQNRDQITMGSVRLEYLDR